MELLGRFGVSELLVILLFVQGTKIGKLLKPSKRK